MSIAANLSASRSISKSGLFFSCVFGIILMAASIVPAAKTAQAQAPRRTAATAKKPLSGPDVEKLWKAGNDAVLANEIRLKGLAFAASFELVDVTLPKDTGVQVASMPASADAIRKLVPKLDLAEVSSKAPDLFSSLKTAAQKKSDADMLPLVDPTIMAAKTLVYDIFDPATFKAYSLGKPAENKYGDVSMPFFELNSSNVEKLYYVRITQFKGKYIIGDFITGPEVADFYLHDEQTLAKSDLETMFRALNDGDQSGLKGLCTPGLYDAIQIWGGNKHPGDRLSHGHTVNQVSVESSVPLDQKSIRVVTKVSYPVSSQENIAFFIDFERVDNGLKMVRIRDDKNKVIVYDPNIDNYLNRRYGLPDGPVVTEANMTEELWAQSLDQLRLTAQRVLQYHKPEEVFKLGKILAEEAPTIPDGYAIRGAAELMQHDGSNADKDAQQALKLDGTSYFIVERKSLSTGNTFGIVVLAISKSTITVTPVSDGGGAPETIDARSIISAKFPTGRKIPGTNIGFDGGPYLKLEYKGPDGKKKSIDFADYGTTCPKSDPKDQLPDLIGVPSNAICGTTSTNGQISSAQAINVLAPRGWMQDLQVVQQIFNTVQGSGHK